MSNTDQNNAANTRISGGMALVVAFIMLGFFATIAFTHFIDSKPAAAPITQTEAVNQNANK